MEPKWRDGDTVPLLPFSQFSRFSRDKIDNEEDEDYDHRGTKYRQSNGRENFLRTRNNHRTLYNDHENYESIENRHGYREREEILPRKRNRSWPIENTATFRETNNRKKDQNRDLNEDKETTSMRYREIFQVRPNDYEHEFNDEEYLKPRPRKRRPPQNYEFALVENETSLNEKRISNNPGAWARGNGQENPPETMSKNDQFLQNAMELKSLLKMQQEEGLSLSEILQRRNLTLNDLLRGKADVINALKMRDIEESEDYVEEAAKMMTNSFAKLSTTTKKPEWMHNMESIKEKDSQNDEEFVISIIPSNSSLRKNQAKGSSLTRINSGEMYSEVGNATSGKLIPASVDPPRVKVAITTPMPLPVATNSMELLQADDATVKSRNNDEIGAESLDEDEIMEFSDFTDYKKGRNGVSPVWLMMKDEDASKSSKVESMKNHFEDRGSTLSIEKILSPTERSKSINNVSINSGNEEQLLNSTNIKNEDHRIIVEHSENDYGISSEKEYQSDMPMMYYDLEQNTEVNNSSNQRDMSKIIIQEIESALDAMSHNVNSTIENYQKLTKNPSIDKNSNNTLKNHQNTNTTEEKSYDDIISEVEPEARAEIFELFASGSAGKRLERLLKSRNMSLEELIALRQRGSSKVHLAEVSRLRAYKSNDEYRMKNVNVFKEIKSSSNEDFDIEKVINNEHYDKGIDNMSQSSENLKSVDLLLNSTNSIRPEENTTDQLMSDLKSKSHNKDIEFNNSSKTRNEDNNSKEDTKDRHTVQIVDLLTTFGSLPFIKDIQREFSDQYGNREDKNKLLLQNNNLGVMFINNEKTIHINDTSNIVESGFVKEIVKQEPSSINIQTVYSETDNIFDENETKSEKTLSRVKPTIIASGAILGVTLVVFLAIFIICRIRQKQKYRYKNTFSRAVFQGPVMAARKLSNSSSLSTVMVNVVATSTTKRPEKTEIQEPAREVDSKSDIDNDSLDANDSWETIPDYMK